MTSAIGIDLGGTNIKGVLINANGEVLFQVIKATKDKREEQINGEEGEWKQTIISIIQELKLHSIHEIGAIGLAAPGLPNPSNSAIRILPERLRGLENLNWSDCLHEKEVWVINDAHAALIAESKFGIGKDKKNIVMLTWGTGIGGGILINGELYQGHFQMAGHLGHMVLDINKENPGITGMPGTMENALGDATVIKRSFGRFESTRLLVEAYKRGDTFATYIWLNSLRQLAMGLCSLSNFLSPELIILGGGVTKAAEDLFLPLGDFMRVYEWQNTGKNTPVKQAQYKEIAGAVGAAGFALSKGVFEKLNQ
ncbi:MAG: ROK family protein [Cyclobacteriaceae bacterium]